MATAAEQRAKNRKFLFGSEDKRTKRASDFQKKLKEAGAKNKAAKAAKDKKRIESQKAINKKLTNVKKEGAAKRKDAREQRRIRLKNDIDRARGKTTTPKKTTTKVVPKASIKSQDAKPNQSNAPKPNFKSFDKATKAEKKVLQKRFPEKKSEVKKSEVKKSKPRSTLQKLFGASEEKRKLGRNMQKRAAASMGMKHGGKVGSKCKMDGIAKRGRTRARGSK